MSLNLKQLPRFCARWLYPGCEGVEAFNQDWRGQNDWLVPPVYLIPTQEESHSGGTSVEFYTNVTLLSMCTNVTAVTICH